MISYINNLKFKNKIFLMTYLIVLLSVSTLFIASLYVTSHHLTKNALSTADDTFELTKSHLENRLDNINVWSLSISQEPRIYKIFTDGIDIKNVFDTNEKFSYINSYITSVNTSDISKIHFFLDMGKPIAGVTVSDLSIAYETDWYKYMVENDISVYWKPPTVTVSEDDQAVTENVLSIIRIVKNPLKNWEPMGIIKVDYKEKVLLDVLNKKASSANSISYIQSADNIVYTSTNSELLDTFDSEAKSFFASSDKWSPYKSGSHRYYVKSSKIHNTNLYIVQAIVSDEMSNVLKSILPWFAMILIIVLLLSYIIANKVSGSVTKRVSELANNLKSVEKEHLVIADSTNISTKDDISSIINSCNHIISRINDLSNRQFQDGQKLKEAEFRIQREQINPHFLYNTLNLIKYLSVKENNTQISDIVTALARFYKISLSNGDEIITIDEELKHIECYAEIQNMRFNNKINLITDVPEEIRSCNTIKLILQPLIENSISHGILEKPLKEGTIKVSAYFDNNDIIMEIEDDGIGIEPDKLPKLLTDESSGFGLKNTHLRIKLYYGEDYGLTIKSEYGKYTLIKVRISRNTNPGRFING